MSLSFIDGNLWLNVFIQSTKLVVFWIYYFKMGLFQFLFNLQFNIFFILLKFSFNFLGDRIFKLFCDLLLIDFLWLSILFLCLFFQFSRISLKFFDSVFDTFNMEFELMFNSYMLSYICFQSLDDFLINFRAAWSSKWGICEWIIWNVWFLRSMWVEFSTNTLTWISLWICLHLCILLNLCFQLRRCFFNVFVLVWISFLTSRFQRVNFNFFQHRFS